MLSTSIKERNEMHTHEYEMKADGITRQMDRNCGAYVCFDCDDHEGLARCYCGWARNGGNGREQLVSMGESVEDDDYGYGEAFGMNSEGWDY